ncbi:MAG: MoaD/ThiS family protein [Candidatus Poseidoniales archaeon]|jgi:molybdopterin converting factor small subunit|tara:strand:- start:642 stop:908 length:267 start_codon:yes stop_codon:yes gene_type:complete
MDPIQPSEGAIKVKVLFFGPLAELMNQKVIELSLLNGTTINQLVERFDLSKYLSQGVLIALNGEVVTNLEEYLQDTSEIAFLPPVSGG